MQKHQTGKRWSDRAPLDFDVGLYGDGQLPFSGTTRDIGIGGMYVLTSADRVTHDSQVFVSYQANVDGEVIRHRIAARVVRIDTDGIGLMFSVFSTDAVHALRGIMDGRHRPVCQTETHDKPLPYSYQHQGQGSP